MLIDFSDLLRVSCIALHSTCEPYSWSHSMFIPQVNVFLLGSTYLKLVKDLNLTIPAIDPSLFISRFASLLEFGDETQQVANDATRLVQRFSRDWMQTGRRPAGICGAALVLAARMNNFRRSIEEVVQVVKIADVTLKKRLAEFSQTASSSLTITDFRTVDLTETADPPAYADERKKEQRKERAKAKKVRFSKTGVLSDEEEEEEDGEEEAAGEEEENRDPHAEGEADNGFKVPATRAKRGLQAINAQMAEMAAAGGSGLAAEEEDADDNEDDQDDLPDIPLSEQDEEGNIRNALASITGGEEDEELESEGNAFDGQAGQLGWNASKVLPPDTRTAEERAADEAESAEITNEIASELTTPHYSMISEELSNKEHARWVQAQNPAALQFTDSSAAYAASGVPAEEPIDTLSDLDEDELDALILTEEEVRIKERLWMEFNKDYLANVAEKHLRAELDERPIKKRDRKKKQQPRDSTMPSGETAAEATKQLLKQKKFSKKINYAAIDALLDPTDDDKVGDIAGEGGRSGFFDADLYGDDAISRSSRAPSLAPSVVASETGSTYSTTTGLLKKRKKSDGRSRRKSSASMAEAEKLQRRLEAGKRAFSPNKRVLTATRPGTSKATGDPTKRAKRPRIDGGREEVESQVGDLALSVADASEAGQTYTGQASEAVEEPNQTMDVEEEEEEPEHEEYGREAAEEEDDMTAEFRRLRGQSGGDEYGGDGYDGW